MIRILFSVVMSFRWWLVVAALALGGFLVARADTATEIRDVLDRNFEAYNREDVEAMLQTLSPTIPKRQEFAEESARLFATTDSHISIEEFEFIEVRGQYATARVVQATYNNAKDELEQTDRDVAYRSQSALLPPAERVEYIQSFKRERGKWRLWAILTQPKPLAAKTTNVNAEQDNCPDGNCSFPRIRVTVR